MTRLLIFLLMAHSAALFAQSLHPLKVRTDSVRFRVVAADTGLALEVLEQRLGQRDFITVGSVRLDDADLAVQYRTDAIKKGFATRVDLSLRPQNGALLTPQAFEIGATSTNAATQQTGWLDINERLLEPEGIYTLYIRKSLLGPVDCAGNRPRFPVARQLPHYGVAVAGLGLLGWGGALHAQSRQRYHDAYRADWIKGLPEPAGQYDAADDKRRYGNRLTAAGWALIGADAAWYAWRWLRIRHKQRIYDQFCAPDAKTDLSRWELRPATGSVGLAFHRVF